jgi:hypothetical protein
MGFLDAFKAVFGAVLNTVVKTVLTAVSMTRTARKPAGLSLTHCEDFA